jgi:hypothetical protein
MKYQISEELIRYLCGFADPVVVHKVARNLGIMGLLEPMKARFEGVGSDDEVEDQVLEVEREIAKSDLAPQFVGSVVQASGAAQGLRLSAQGRKSMKTSRIRYLTLRKRGHCRSEDLSGRPTS